MSESVLALSAAVEPWFQVVLGAALVVLAADRLFADDRVGGARRATSSTELRSLAPAWPLRYRDGWDENVIIAVGYRPSGDSVADSVLPPQRALRVSAPTARHAGRAARMAWIPSYRPVRV